MTGTKQLAFVFLFVNTAPLTCCAYSSYNEALMDAKKNHHSRGGKTYLRGGTEAIKQVPNITSDPAVKKDEDGCQYFTVATNKYDIDKNTEKNAVGGVITPVPFYNMYGTKLGTVTETYTSIPSSLQQIGTQSYNFFDRPTNYPDSIYSVFDTNVSTMYSPVAGGTGSYSCASGFKEIFAFDSSTFHTTFTLCGNPCPG